MPQPLSHYHVTSVSVGAERVGSVYPKADLALSAMGIIADWSTLEAFLNDLYVLLIGENEEAAIEEFSSNRSLPVKLKKIRCAADESVKKGLPVKLIHAVVGRIEEASRTRHKLCHWTWGHSDDLPDAILLADPKHAQARRQATYENPTDRFKGILVFKQNDLDDAAKRLRIATRNIAQLRFIVVQPDHPYIEEKIRILSVELGLDL